MKSLRSQAIFNVSNIYSISLHSISLILCDEIFIDRLFAIDSLSMKEAKKSVRVRWTQSKRTHEKLSNILAHGAYIAYHRPHKETTTQKQRKKNHYTIYSIGFSIFCRLEFCIHFGLPFHSTFISFAPFRFVSFVFGCRC